MVHLSEATFCLIFIRMGDHEDNLVLPVFPSLRLNLQTLFLMSVIMFRFQIVPFLALGLSVDDMFLITKTFAKYTSKNQFDSVKLNVSILNKNQ
jgi:Sterol-sensing domain of SREBP cleavage-activation.